MKFKKITITALTFFVILSGCGFKPLKMSNINNISLAELDVEGNKFINFKISAYLKQTLNFKKNNETQIKVSVNSKKKRDIKEKNSKNEITKYNLYITSEVKVDIVGTGKNFTFTLTKLNEYRVDDQYSVTVQNEKRATNEIINILSQDIVKNILLKIS
jgi:hypothetical protein